MDNNTLFKNICLVYVCVCNIPLPPICVCVSVHTLALVHVCVSCTCVKLENSCRSQFLLSTIWILGMELRLASSVWSTFPRPEPSLQANNSFCSSFTSHYFLYYCYFYSFMHIYNTLWLHSFLFTLCYPLSLLFNSFFFLTHPDWLPYPTPPQEPLGVNNSRILVTLSSFKAKV